MLTELKNRITKSIWGITFFEIEEVFKLHNFDYKGDSLIEALPENSNRIIWSGWNEHAINLIFDMLKDIGDYSLSGCNWLPYTQAGFYLNLPIARKEIKYKAPHWEPRLLKLSEIGEFSGIVCYSRKLQNGEKY